jgi:chitin synthase
MNGLCRIYAVLSAYLIACSLVLTAKAFSVSETYKTLDSIRLFRLQSINPSQATTIGGKITTLLSGTNGVLLAALASTFGECIT